MTGAEVLAAYHYQPNLERRNHLLKGPQEVAPVYLETEPITGYCTPASPSSPTPPPAR